MIHGYRFIHIFINMPLKLKSSVSEFRIYLKIQEQGKNCKGVFEKNLIWSQVILK